MRADPDPSPFDVGTLRHLPALLKPASPTANQTESSYRTLRRRILELELRPGDRFTESMLAAEFGVSKTPVREALVRLHHDGLVAPAPRAGYVVTPVTLRSTRDLCQLRSILEPKAAELAARRRVSDGLARRLTELSDIELAHPYASDKEGVDRYLRGHFEFQSIIANACGNDRLAQTIVELLDGLEHVLRLCLGEISWSRDRVDQRSAIARAIREGDPDAAYQHMLRRTTEGGEEIIAALMEIPSVIDSTIVKR
ncbi:GntR family transcriptional regulator [Streptomyces sp. NPDC058665]|uniref:GntR family transcriptional regulator n=1 Tax=Streptomyces sp. NPDC058665 TaxID=3346586 RepID=UPI003663CE33